MGSFIKQMKELKLGLSKQGRKLYTTFKESNGILIRGHFESMDPIELLGAAVFKAYHDTELIVPEHLSYPTTHDVGTLNNASIAYIQRVVGESLLHKMHMVKSKFKHPELIHSNLTKLVKEASECTLDVIPDASQSLSSLYDLRSHYQSNFFLSLGHVVNSMTNPENCVRTYVQQAQKLDEIIKRKIKSKLKK